MVRIRMNFDKILCIIVYRLWIMVYRLWPVVYRFWKTVMRLQAQQPVDPVADKARLVTT